jgi:SAM-dependent methyltransferase
LSGKAQVPGSGHVAPEDRAPPLHAAAKAGFAAEAASYARGRPDYPADLLPWLQRALALGPGKVALDLGAGTGKFTRLLARTEADVVAVEPIAQMRAKLSAELPAIRALAGTADAIPLADACLDAVVCAQSFHWFATEAALREIHRVLRPGGRLGLVWNVRDETVDWVAALTDIVTPFEGDAPRFYKGDWREPFASGLFGELQMTPFDYRHSGPPQEVIIDRFLSVSFIAALPAAKKALVAQQLRALVDSHPDLRGRGTIDFPYRTQAYHGIVGP